MGYGLIIMMEHGLHVAMEQVLMRRRCVVIKVRLLIFMIWSIVEELKLKLLQPIGFILIIVPFILFLCGTRHFCIILHNFILQIHTLLDPLKKYWPSLSCSSSTCHGGKGSFWAHEVTITNTRYICVNLPLMVPKF